jgi:protease-4
MNSVFLKIKNIFTKVNRGILKLSDWMINGFKVVLVVGVVLYALGIGWVVFYSDKVSLDDHTVLVMDLKGVLVEESPGGFKDKFIGELQGKANDTVRLRDLVMTLDLAAQDKHIDKVLLKLDDFQGGGLVSLREAASALEKFKASGKHVIAWSGFYDQRQYYLAAHANQVLSHPMGGVLIEGFGRNRNYYKDALDKLGIKANLIRVGQFKSAGEPFVLNAPSQQALKAEAHVYDALWSLYTGGVEKARNLPAGSIDQNMENLPEAFVNVKGNAAQLALDWKWLDGVQTFESLRESLMKELGKDEGIQSFRQVGWKDYLVSEVKKVKGEHIAIVVAEGEIGDGRAPAGKIGGISTSERIRKAADDQDVKAIVLRVNSPGGSVFGSELIREQLQIAKDKGKPVVVSMGNLAASGGYWISMASDVIIADPATISGSIGVFAMLPTGEGLMSKIGVNTGGYQTSWLAGAYDPRKALDPRMQSLVQSSIENIYADFIGKVSQSRKIDLAQVDDLAQGRIWTGAQAVEHKLIDKLGSFADAVEAARALAAQLDGANSSDKVLPFKYVGPKTSPFERFAQKFMGQFGWLAGESMAIPEWRVMSGHAGPDALLLNTLGQDLAWLQTVIEKKQPFGAAAHCLCNVSP